MKLSLKTAVVALAALGLSQAASAETISLAGQWGIRHSAADSATATTIMLPGSMLTNGIGNRPCSNNCRIIICQ